MARLFYMALVSLLVSCASASPVPGTALFAYEDFGPQVVAREIIGMAWWQWQAAGNSRPRKYDIKVVVYKDVGLEEVKKRFPVNPATNQDFRYVEYGVAIDYLDRVIEEDVMESLTAQLVDTRARIQAAFRGKSPP